MTMHQCLGKDMKRIYAATYHSKYLYKRWRSGRRRMVFNMPANTLVFSHHSDEGCQVCQFFVFVVCFMAVFVWVMLHIILYYNVNGDARYKQRMKDMRLTQDLIRVKHDIGNLILQVKNTSRAEALQRLMHRVYANRIANIINKANEETRKVWLDSDYNDDADNNTTTTNNNNSDEDLRKSVLYNPNTESPRNLSTQRCPEEPPGLQGHRKNEPYMKPKTQTLDEIHQEHLDVRPGGEWEPKDCVARHRLAVVIPYRDRQHHLVELLAKLLPILKRQQLHFRIFVVEQHGRGIFNKGRLMNAAFWEASALFDFDCVVFHDVDLVSLDDRNMYTCSDMPRHMSVAIDVMNNRLPYAMLVGGVLSFRVEHFRLVNGYSNLYWGWGAEDDDMARRILHVGLHIQRPPICIARFHKLVHVKRKPSTFGSRTRLLKKTTMVYHVDGLNSVPYKLIRISRESLYTHIIVDIGDPYKVKLSK